MEDLSSEDEICMSDVREAIDQRFWNDGLYNKEKTDVPQSSNEKPPEANNRLRENLRIYSKQEAAYASSFDISPTFQSFVAKKLEKILEGTIKLKDNTSVKHRTKRKRKKKNNFGVKLLSTSNTCLVAEATQVQAECEKEKKKLKRKKYEIVEDNDALFKFREAAVNPERILSKSDVKAWVNRRPEPDFKYKRLQNGALLEQV